MAVTADGKVVVAAGRARVDGIAAPGTAAQHSGLAILLVTLVAIRYPLPDVAVHVVQLPGIGRKIAKHRNSRFLQRKA